MGKPTFWTGAVAAAVLLACTQTWAVNKCTGPDGKVVFQDQACPGKGERIVVRPASGYGAEPVPAALPAAAGATPSQPMTEAERLNALTAESQRQRRRLNLERSVPNMRDAIDRHRVQCAQRQAALRSDKLRANNNLAGAVWEQSLSAEMSAAAATCDTRSRELRDELETARKECRELGGCS